MRSRLIHWLPAIIWMAVIFYLSAQTGETLNSFLPYFDYFFPAMKSFDWGHFAAYFVLSCTFYWALSGKSSSFGVKFLAVLLCILYGMSDEYHQSFVSGRMPDWTDIRNDTIGSLLAMLLVSLPAVDRFYRKLRTRKY